GSGVRTPRVPWPGTDGIGMFSLSATLDEGGRGKGKLTLDPNTRKFNEVGDTVETTTLAPIELECTLTFVKMGKVQVGPGRTAAWPLYQIEGKKLTRRLFLVAPTKALRSGRLLIEDKAGVVAYVIGMRPPVGQGGD